MYHHKVSFNVTGNFSNGTIDINEGLCTGWYSLTECAWGNVLWQTSTNAELYTYVFQVKTILGAEVGWYPTTIQNARVAYSVCKTIPQIVFHTNMPKVGSGENTQYQLPRPSIGTMRPLNTTNVDCYQWCLMTCSSNSNCENLQYDAYGVRSTTPNNTYIFGLENYGYNGGGPCGGDAPGYRLYERLTMGNYGGCSQQTATTYKIVPLVTQIGGCPWMWVQTSDTTVVPENNAFHKSEFSEFYGNDITDLYVLQNKPYLDSNNIISIQLNETVNDYTLFDQIKLYAVDHPEGTKIGVTESGDIVLYWTSEAVSTSFATLNQNSEITPYINYNYSGQKIVRGGAHDSIYAQYDSSSQAKMKNSFIQLKKQKFGSQLDGGGYVDSLALIGELGHNPDVDYVRYPIANKDWAGYVAFHSLTSVVTKPFSKRERNAEVIIPFGSLSDAFDFIDVNFADDYEVTYFSVVPVSYYGFTQTSLDLVSAENNAIGDITSLISSKNYSYAYLDSTCVIALQFQDNTTLEYGNVRDYVIQFDGYYTTTLGGGDNIHNNSSNVLQHLTAKNEQPFTFKLFNNYPNPFNPVTSIKYSIPKDANTSLKVFNAVGQLVSTLVSEFQKTGEYEVSFNAENYPSGIYFYMLESGSQVSTKKMALVK